MELLKDKQRHMAGHSKWHNIQKRKGVQDKKRSKEFTAVARLIMSSVKKSGVTDPEQNPTLRLALDKARAVNMPNENIKRAIARGSGKSESGVALEEIVYEGYGPYGIGFMVLARTDNKQRTGAQIRNLFTAHGGSLAGPGAAGYLFSMSEGEYTPTITVEITSEQFEAIENFESELESEDDVDGVWHNAVIASS